MILVADTETTGLTLHPKAPRAMQPRVCEVGGVFLDPATGLDMLDFSQLINPEIPIPPEVTKIHGITDAMVADAPTFAQFMPTLQRWMREATVIVAHNLPFDRHILRYEVIRADPENRFNFFDSWPAKEFDTIDLYREAWGKDMKLSALYEVVTGKKLEKSHRVMPDVNALVAIIQADKLFEIMR